jgi:large subunit ribosomal protein L7/L12
MSDDGGFLRAIEDDPEEDAARLAYADWLDERGDVRGEYLRLEHQLSQIPPRLAQLRDQIDPAWLTAVSRRCKVVLVSFQPERKIEVIRLVRMVTGVGLKEAKDLVETVRGTVAEGLTREEAEQLAERFRGVAVVSVEPATAG